jgi:hypothetical protein
MGDTWLALAGALVALVLALVLALLGKDTWL